VLSRNASKPRKTAYKLSAPGRIRTADTLVRSQVLYPAELRAQARSLASVGHFGNSIANRVVPGP
jgi:hypothetical protein